MNKRRVIPAALLLATLTAAVVWYCALYARGWYRHLHAEYPQNVHFYGKERSDGTSEYVRMVRGAASVKELSPRGIPVALCWQAQTYELGEIDTETVRHIGAQIGPSPFGAAHSVQHMGAHSFLDEGDEGYYLWFHFEGSTLVEFSADWEGEEEASPFAVTVGKGKPARLSLTEARLEELFGKPLAVTRGPKYPSWTSFHPCISNLREIDRAKEAWWDSSKSTGDIPTGVDLEPFLGRPWPEYQCFFGGTYTINPLGTDPTCSCRGHLL